jgi:hypothetical protein
MSSEETRRTPEPARRPRRAFLKAVAVGGATAAVAPFVAPERAAAAVEAPPLPWFLIKTEIFQISPQPPVFIVTKTFEAEIGQIELDSILLTYASAPLSARGSLTVSLTNTRSETISASTESGRTVSSSRTLFHFSQVKVGDVEVAKFGFTGGSDRVQGQSSKVTNAVTHASTLTQTIQTVPVTDGGYNRWEHTAFLIMARPTFKILTSFLTVNDRLIPPNGPAPLLFRFLHGGTIFPRSARELRDDPSTRAFIGQASADSILAEYPLRPDQTSGVALGLSEPRFGPPTFLSPGEAPFTFTETVTSAETNTVALTNSSTKTIRSGFSISLFGEQLLDFQTSRSFTVTHSSVQEESSTQILSTTGTVTSDLHHQNRIYKDRRWNTVLITDEGPLPGVFSAVTGTVTATDGSPIDGAVVTMLVGGVTHETFTGKDGRYTLRLGGDVKPGDYEVTCAGVTRIVTVSHARTATADYRRVSSKRAHEAHR